MRRPYLEHYVAATRMPAIRRVDTLRPWFWLAAGWRDFVNAPLPSLCYGLLATAAFAVISLSLASGGYWHWAIALMPGFLFLGPVLAFGLYEIARRGEGELPSTLADSLRGWRRNTRTLLSLGVVMVLLLLAWGMVALQLTALFAAHNAVPAPLLDNTPDLVTFLAALGWPLVLAISLSGVAALTIAFILMAIAVPLAMDHEDIDVITAMVVSIKAVRRNKPAMLLWATLITLFAGIGIVPLYLGLTFTFPLLGYATWHAYREIVDQ